MLDIVFYKDEIDLFYWNIPFMFTLLCTIAFPIGLALDYLVKRFVIISSITKLFMCYLGIKSNKKPSVARNCYTMGFAFAVMYVIYNVLSFFKFAFSIVGVVTSVLYVFYAYYAYRLKRMENECE